MSKKIKIAITGGMGSGKSSFGNIFSEKGFLVIKADDISKEILSNDESVQELVVEYFGEECFDENGNPNKKYIAQKVFSSEENISIINSILHPPTIDSIKNMMNKELQKSDMVFVEAALIYEANMYPLFDYVVLITAEKSLRIKRIMGRDNVSEEEILRRMEKQLSEEKKKELADFVIENNGSTEELTKKCNFFFKLFTSFTNTK